MHLTATGSETAGSASAVAGGDHVAASRSEASGLSGTWALFVGLGLLMLGNGLNGAVIGVRSANEGFSLTVTGVIMAT